MTYFTHIVYNQIFPLIGVIIGLYGMIFFGKRYYQTHYYWKGVKFLICLVFTASYFFMLTDHFFGWWDFGPWFYITVLRPINLLMVTTLILDIPHAD